MITLSRWHPYTLTSLEEHRALFGQGRPLLEPAIHPHEVFTTTTPDKPSNFGQTLKVHDWFNWIEGSYAQYD